MVEVEVKLSGKSAIDNREARCPIKNTDECDLAVSIQLTGRAARQFTGLVRREDG